MVPSRGPKTPKRVNVLMTARTSAYPKGSGLTQVGKRTQISAQSKGLPIRERSDAAGTRVAIAATGAEMTILEAFIALGVTLVTLLVGIWLRRITTAWTRYRGHRLVICPESQRPAGVVVDAVHAAATAAAGNPELRLIGCSRWPERAACGQECMAQVQSSPSDCLVDHVLTRWYDGKFCAWCGQPVGKAYWTACKPVLLTNREVLRQWDEIPIPEVPEALSGAVPVCFHCFVRSHAAPSGSRAT